MVSRRGVGMLLLLGWAQKKRPSNVPLRRTPARSFRWLRVALVVIKLGLLAQLVQLSMPIISVARHPPVCTRAPPCLLVNRPVRGPADA